MRLRVHIGSLLLSFLLGGWAGCFGLNPQLDVSQYGHTSWTARDGFSLGNVYAMAQTPDGYLWLGSEFGLFRFDGVRFSPWQLATTQHLPGDGVYSLLATRDGTLWIGMFDGLASWRGGKLTRYKELEGRFVTSLLEDREGTVWAATLGTPAGAVCAVHSGRAQCSTQDGAFGGFVWGLYEDSSGVLWTGAESGLWRWKPGPPRRYPTPKMRITDLSRGDDGRVLIGMSGAGLMQVAGDKMEPYPIRSAVNPKTLLADHDVDSNKLLRDRDGGLWIGTADRGLIHVHHGRTDMFTKSDGLSGNISCSLFEDREGNVWVATVGGLDRFRELAVTTVSMQQGLSSDNVSSVIAAADGSVWVATHDGLNRLKNGQISVFRKTDGLPDDFVQSLFQDDRGRLWASTPHGLSYFMETRFVAVPDLPSEAVSSMTGARGGNLWLSEHRGLLHLLNERLVEQFPWSAMGRRQQAKVIADNQGGLWLSFWLDGGVLYFRDGRVRARYTVADGLGKGEIASFRLDREGALWAATQQGGLSRIKDGRIATLTTRNGLPCDTIHWSMEDEDRSLWLYTACGLVRITRVEVDAWLADSIRKIEMRMWDAADGVRLRAIAPSTFGPIFAKAEDGTLWFVGGEGIQVLDPRHLAENKLPPPVYIEKIVANHKTWWQNSAGASISNVHLPPLIRDLEIDFTALSLVAPEKMHFKYMLKGQNRNWHEVVNDRKVQYTNLAPGTYRFRVIASNNSGVWNESGDMLQFSIAPAYYQTAWFTALCVALLLAALCAAYWWRLRQLHHQFEMTLDARVAERTRIARDLHDTLLQSFQGLLLQFQTASQLLPMRPIEAKEKLDSSIDKAAVAITEGRDAVQGLRTSAIQTNDLANSLNTLGNELAADPANGSSPALRVTVEGEPRSLHPILRDDVFKIAAEALRNAFRHAQANRVEVEIRYDDQQFRLRVRDDGRGMDATAVLRQEPEGHFGVSGMQERAALARGKLVIWSTPGAGTEVELRVPAGAAYTKAPSGSLRSRTLAGKA